jgi:hypothetical protein
VCVGGGAGSAELGGGGMVTTGILLPSRSCWDYCCMLVHGVKLAGFLVRVLVGVLGDVCGGGRGGGAHRSSAAVIQLLERLLQG